MSNFGSGGIFKGNTHAHKAADDPEIQRLKAELRTLIDQGNVEISKTVAAARMKRAQAEVRLAEANRAVLADYRSKAEALEAKGQDGDAIRRQCEEEFKAEAADWRAEHADMDGDWTYRILLSYIPECWR